MFARFDENPAMSLQDIKETKRYGRTDARTYGQRENSIPHHKQSLRGYNKTLNYLVHNHNKSPDICHCKLIFTHRFVQNKFLISVYDILFLSI